MIKNKKVLTIVVAAILVVLIGWKIYSGTKRERSNTIKIGAVLPLTGIAAIPGTSEQKGIQLAVKEINEAGGIAGKQVEVVFEDDQTDPKTTVSAVEKEITSDGVEAIIGGTWDFLANAAAPVIDRDHKVLISPSALPDTLQSTSAYLFTTHSPVAVNESVFEKFLNQFQNGKVAIVTVHNAWGQAHSNTFKKAIAATHSTLLKEVTLPNFDNNDIQRELSLLRPLHPDAILTAMNFGDYSVFMKKTKEFGISSAVLGHSDLADAYAAGTIPKNVMEGAVVYKFSDPQEDFQKRFTAMFAADPGTYADTAYDAVYVIKRAIENSGGKYDADSIVAGLHQIKNYQGASGPIDYSANNYPVNKTPILEVFRNGQFVVMKNQ